MDWIEAIYQAGVFRPLSEIALPENQRVRLNVEPLEGTDARTWLEQIQRLQRPIIEQRGFFPDSTADIAADRAR